MCVGGWGSEWARCVSGGGARSGLRIQKIPESRPGRHGGPTVETHLQRRSLCASRLIPLPLMSASALVSTICVRIGLTSTGRRLCTRGTVGSTAAPPPCMQGGGTSVCVYGCVGVSVLSSRRRCTVPSCAGFRAEDSANILLNCLDYCSREYTHHAWRKCRRVCW